MTSKIKRLSLNPIHSKMLSNLGYFAFEKIWLPRMLYALIPFIYLFAGLFALLSALYLPGWRWLIPYALIGAGAAIHAAATVGIARFRGSQKMARGVERSAPE
jgi:fatty acid desaturase